MAERRGQTLSQLAVAWILNNLYINGLNNRGQYWEQNNNIEKKDKNV